MTSEHVTPDTRPRCEREILTRTTQTGRDYRTCGQPAVVRSDRTMGGGTSPYSVYYCRKHKKHASTTDRPDFITIVRVVPIVVEK